MKKKNLIVLIDYLLWSSMVVFICGQMLLFTYAALWPWLNTRSLWGRLMDTYSRFTFKHVFRDFFLFVDFFPGSNLNIFFAYFIFINLSAYQVNFYEYILELLYVFVFKTKFWTLTKQSAFVKNELIVNELF